MAVKIFTDQARAEACSGDKAAEFRREIAILKGCRDRNIVQFIGACLQEGRTILVTGADASGHVRVWHARII